MKKIALALLLASTLAVSGCLAPANNWKTFNSLTTWNEKVTDNKWYNELIFLGLNIIPVYGIAFLADEIVFNSIEFWNYNGTHVAQTSAK
jgi:hypothetical protein